MLKLKWTFKKSKDYPTDAYSFNNFLNIFCREDKVLYLCSDYFLYYDSKDFLELSLGYAMNNYIKLLKSI